VSRSSLELGSRTCLKSRSWSGLGSGVRIEFEVAGIVESGVVIQVRSRVGCLVGEWKSFSFINHTLENIFHSPTKYEKIS